MTDASGTFDKLLGACLRQALSRDRSSDETLPLDVRDWLMFFEHAGNALVTPWLQPTLGAAAGLGDVPRDVPREVMETIDEIARANVERNRAAIADWHALVDTLAAVDVPVWPLKGIAVVAHGHEPHARYRVLGDIDALVAATDLDRALGALAAAGYRQQRNPYLTAIRYDASDFAPLDPNDAGNRLDASKHHVPPVLRAGGHLSVEIHVEPAVRFTAQAGTLADWAQAEMHHRHPATSLSPTFHLLHAFQHAELNDAAATAGVLDWRHLLDAAAWLDGGADLARVSRALEGSAAMPVFEAWCRQLETELDLELPPRRVAPAVARRATRIERRRARSWSAHLARRGPWIARRLRQARRFRAELRGRFGPEPLLRQLRLLVVYLWRSRGA